MMAQIENTPDGYIVGVYLRDGNGYGHWYRLRNFGDRQGNAIAFREYDLPTFSDQQIKLFIKTFDVGKKYMRKEKGRYVKTNDDATTI